MKRKRHTYTDEVSEDETTDRKTFGKRKRYDTEGFTDDETEDETPVVGDGLTQAEKVKLARSELKHQEKRNTREYAQQAAYDSLKRKYYRLMFEEGEKKKSGEDEKEYEARISRYLEEKYNPTKKQLYDLSKQKNQEKLKTWNDLHDNLYLAKHKKRPYLPLDIIQSVLTPYLFTPFKSTGPIPPELQVLPPFQPTTSADPLKDFDDVSNPRYRYVGSGAPSFLDDEDKKRLLDTWRNQWHSKK